MSNLFFDQPILNSPYAEPTRHWKLDETGQPTQEITEFRRPASFISPIPNPQKSKGKIKQLEHFDFHFIHIHMIQTSLGHRPQ